MKGSEIIIVVDKLAEMSRYVSNGSGQRTIYNELIAQLRNAVVDTFVEVGKELSEEINENKEVVVASVSLLSRFLNLFRGGKK